MVKHSLTFLQCKINDKHSMPMLLGKCTSIHKVAACEHRPPNKNSEAANIHTDNRTFTLAHKFPFIQELEVLQITTNYHTERHTYAQKIHKIQQATAQLLSVVLCDALCVAAGGGLVGTSTAAHRYIYLSCFRGSVFRLNIGLADGEERGLMEDRKENAQQTQRKKVLENKVNPSEQVNCEILHQWS